MIFEAWYGDAVSHEPRVPNAMQLCTVDARGRPSCRTVLLKGFDAQGLVFYTNHTSRKATQFSEQREVALLFHWKSLERQVHVEGRVEPVSSEVSDAYFATRDRGSQLGAWASRQSATRDKGQLEKAVEEMTRRFADGPVPRPEFWGGYRVVPARWEFWQGKPDRLHERRVFERLNGEWTACRLDP
jgi:pyridoxamine 5'-phosphate oxidase